MRNSPLVLPQLVATDLSDTQQQMLGINQRYEILGERLTERQQELQAVLTSIRSFSQDMQEVISWLEVKDKQINETNSSGIPANEKGAKNMLKSHEEIHHELLGKEGLVEEIRKKAQELMKARPDVAGLDSLQLQLTDLDDKWHGLRAVSEERRKALEDAVSDLRDFREHEDQLSRWFTQKEKLMDVLGPVAMEPSLLRSQMEQVKVLKDEFKTQEATFDRFISCGHSIMDWVEPHSQDATDVSKRMDAVSKAWNKLQGRLKEREKNIDSIQGVSGEFSTVTRDLANWLGDFSDRLEKLPKINPQPDKQASQKQEMHELEQEMQGRLPAVGKAKELCKQLCDQAKDPATKSDLRSKMAALDKDLNETLKKLESRAEALEAAAQAGKEFNADCEKMLTWIQKTSAILMDTPAMTTDSDLIQRQAIENKSLKQDLKSREPEVHVLLDKGQKFLQDASPTEETRNLQDVLDRLGEEWGDLKETVDERDTKISTAAVSSLAFQQKLDKMLWWLSNAEDKLKKLTPEVFDKNTIVGKTKELQSLQNEIHRKSHDHDNLNHEADNLLGLVEDPQGDLRRQVDDVNSRWDNITSCLAEKSQSLEDLQSRLAEIEDNISDAKHNLTRWEDKLAAHMDMGTAARDPKHIDKIKALKDDISNLDSQLDYLDALLEGDDLDHLDPGDLQKQAKTLHDRHTQLEAEVGELLSNMETGSSIVAQFQDMMKNMSTQLLEMDTELSQMSPVSRGEDELDAQLVEVKNFKQQLQNKSEPLSDIKEQAMDLQLAGFVSHTEALNSQVEGLLGQKKRLTEKANNREKEIEGIAEKVRGINNSLQNLHSNITKAVSDVDSLNPVASNIKVIKEQQEELKKFNKDQVDPLQKQLDKVNGELQNLIQSAPSGVSTGGIDSELETLQEQWSELNEKVSDRERCLDKALLQTGKFKDALDSMVAWLAETEDTMANQKPASAEVRVVKAQLQEQKLLQKMIDDRAPSVASVKDSGKQLLPGLDPAERRKLEEELNTLDRRWSEVMGNAGDRMKTLEKMAELARQFQEIHEPLAVWLDISDKKFTALEPKSADAGGIEKLIGELKHLQEEIAKREEPAQELASLGKQLQDHCKGEDVVIVQVKIDDVQKQQNDFKNKVDDSLEQIEEALPLALRFEDAHDNVMEWVAQIEPALRGKEPTGAEAVEEVQNLLEQLDAIQPYMEVLNSEGAELADVAPGDAGLRVEEMVDKDNKRYNAIKEQIEKRAEKVRMSRQKSEECMNELGELTEWFEEGENKLKTMPPVSHEPVTLEVQLIETKSFNEEVGNQRSKVRDAVTSGKKLLREASVEDEDGIRGKMDHLKDKSEAVAGATSERLNHLEQALPLARSFKETHNELSDWLNEVEPALVDLGVMSVDADQVKKQHENVKGIKQDVSDHKPTVDRLNKTGSALLQLVGPEAAVKVQDKLDEDNQRMEGVRTSVRERSNSIDIALQQSAEFTDKLEDMLENLTTTAETLQNAEPVSAHPDKIREQIEENKTIDEDMQMRSTALKSVKEAADELLKQAGDISDPAVRDVQQKLAELTRLYKDIQNNIHDRNSTLEDTLVVSEKFWEDLNSLAGSIKELQEGLASQEKPALEPEAIREQQEELEAIKEDIAASVIDLEDLQQTGDQLVGLVGEPEKPEVQKNLDDTGTTLNELSEKVEKRSKDLETALAKAITFQDEMSKLMIWMQVQEEALKEMEPIAGEFEAIKSQWNDIKVFKGIIDPKHVAVEALNQQAEELSRDCTVEQAAVVKEPVSDANHRWDGLQAHIGGRQRDLQMALLALGHFDQAYRDFKAWLEAMDGTLDELEPVFGDPKIVEIELAKLRIVQNDITAHDENLESLNEESSRLMSEETGIQAGQLKRKMADLTKHWDEVKVKAAQRKQQLEDARREARGFTEELQEILMKIRELDSQMITSQPVGGLPETAKEQLDKFKDVYADLEKLEPAVQSLQLMSDKLATKSRGAPAASIRHNMANIQQKWAHLNSRAQDRKKKLEDAVGLAGNFHKELNKFIGWLTDTEKTLNNLQPVSRLVDKVTTQIEDHRALQKDVSGHREAMFALDKMGTHLKYFSQKQDVILIKNLLTSVQHRWEKIVSRSAERTRHLERGYKEAKQFYDSLKDLLLWLKEAQEALSSDTNISNEPGKIKAQIVKHKEFQRRLGAKQPVYDGINRTGSSLQNRCPEDDKPALQALLGDLKNRWNSVCGKSVDRQRKLEEGLLFTGQFNEALEALLDWLAKMEPSLAEDSPLHGDLDTVNGFLETHKAFQQELGARANTVEFVRKSAKDLIENSSEDTSNVQTQLIELSSLWDRTCKLSVIKQERLEQAHCLADEFNKKAHGLLGWLADAERQLRFKGIIPEEETAIMQQIDDHKRFEESMLRQESSLRETLNIGQDIMKRCHPDAVSTMKHWLGVLRTRWEELMALSRQRQKRLTDAITDTRTSNSLLDELLAWLNGAEIRLTDLDSEVIPNDMQIIQDLISQHQAFQTDMSSKQPDVDKLIKADKRKAGSSSAPVSSNIPALRSGNRHTPKSRIPKIRVDSSGRKTPDPHGRKTPEHFSGRRTPDVSGRKTPDVSGRVTPDHHSGRRTPDHSGRRSPVPGFSNPRVGGLFNKWRQVWLMAMDRQRKLQDALDYLNELERLKNFEFDPWRKRYLTWMNHNKARIMDFFRRVDKDRDGRVTRQEFIEGILMSKFPTSRLEMECVADIFDKDGDGFINYKEFVAALRPDREVKPETESEKIMDEVRRQCSKCTCVKQFKIHKIGEGKYRFGDSQKLRLVRILRSTVMVRVGGGWIALDEFLVKNDPCRAKGRTNTELRENFTLAQGVSQSMTGFVSKSPGGSSSGSSYSGRSNSTTSGPITKVREKTVYQPKPWSQRPSKTSVDGEVHQIMSRTTPDQTRLSKVRGTQPRSLQSPVSRSSSRASNGSRPASRAGSEASDDPDVFLSSTPDRRSVSSRTDSPVSHLSTTPRSSIPVPSGSKSRIPKISPPKKK